MTLLIRFAKALYHGWKADSLARRGSVRAAARHEYARFQFDTPEWDKLAKSAVVLMRGGAYGEAIPVFERSIERRVATLGEWDEQTVGWLTECHERSDDFDGAINVRSKYSRLGDKATGLYRTYMNYRRRAETFDRSQRWLRQISAMLLEQASGGRRHADGLDSNERIELVLEIVTKQLAGERNVTDILRERDYSDQRIQSLIEPRIQERLRAIQRSRVEDDD
jgi:hypothetical protein